jgi:hypothetical protein
MDAVYGVHCCPFPFDLHQQVMICKEFQRQGNERKYHKTKGNKTLPEVGPYEAGEFGLPYTSIDYPSLTATTLDKLLCSSREVGRKLAAVSLYTSIVYSLQKDKRKAVN